jgi:hypothetical protein
MQRELSNSSLQVNEEQGNAKTRKAPRNKNGLTDPKPQTSPPTQGVAELAFCLSGFCPSGFCCRSIQETPPSAKGIKLHRLKSPVYTHTDPFPCQVARKCHEILTIS